MDELGDAMLTTKKTTKKTKTKKEEEERQLNVCRFIE
jgi:hypothetical protein